MKVPKDRIGVVIGKKGRTKRKLERIGGVKVNVDSQEGVVSIEGENDEMVIKTADVVKAMGRGFDEKSALRLYSDGVYLTVVSLRDLIPRRHIPRQRARLIGTEGSARKRMEELSGTSIRIYGDTVSIIGDFEGTYMVIRAVERLVVEGAPHTTVFREMEREKTRRENERLYRELGLLKDDF